MTAAMGIQDHMRVKNEENQSWDVTLGKRVAKRQRGGVYIVDEFC